MTLCTARALALEQSAQGRRAGRLRGSAGDRDPLAARLLPGARDQASARVGGPRARARRRAGAARRRRGGRARPASRPACPTHRAGGRERPQNTAAATRVAGEPPRHGCARHARSSGPAPPAHTGCATRAARHARRCSGHRRRARPQPARRPGGGERAGERRAALTGPRPAGVRGRGVPIVPRPPPPRWPRRSRGRPPRPQSRRPTTAPSRTAPGKPAAPATVAARATDAAGATASTPWERPRARPRAGGDLIPRLRRRRIHLCRPTRRRSGRRPVSAAGTRLGARQPRRWGTLSRAGPVRRRPPPAPTAAAVAAPRRRPCLAGDSAPARRGRAGTRGGRAGTDPRRRPSAVAPPPGPRFLREERSPAKATAADRGRGGGRGGGVGGVVLVAGGGRTARQPGARLRLGAVDARTHAASTVTARRKPTWWCSTARKRTGWRTGCRAACSSSGYTRRAALDGRPRKRCTTSVVEYTGGHQTEAAARGSDARHRPGAAAGRRGRAAGGLGDGGGDRRRRPGRDDRRRGRRGALRRPASNGAGSAGSSAPPPTGAGTAESSSGAAGGEAPASGEAAGGAG